MHLCRPPQRCPVLENRARRRCIGKASANTSAIASSAAAALAPWKASPPSCMPAYCQSRQPWQSRAGRDKWSTRPYPINPQGTTNLRSATPKVRATTTTQQQQDAERKVMGLRSRMKKSLVGPQLRNITRRAAADAAHVFTGDADAVVIHQILG